MHFISWPSGLDGMPDFRPSGLASKKIFLKARSARAKGQHGGNLVCDLHSLSNIDYRENFRHQTYFVVLQAAMVKYSREPENPVKCAKARASDLRVHFKV